ncbi:hypothetical protein DMC01_01610 [Campylobacter troglodytis]|nr:hypothetical protein DMC01_01610 [Campylobacter troglodytis]
MFLLRVTHSFFCEKGCQNSRLAFIHSNTCSAKELLATIKDFAELNECEIYKKASKPTVPWLICVQKLITE